MKLFNRKTKENMSPTDQIKQIEREMRWNKFKSPQVQSVIAFILALVILVSGSSAYFADRATTGTQGTAGTVAVSIDDSNINLLNANGADIFNPGDIRDFGFTINNDGNKSVDAKAVITLTSSVPMNKYYDDSSVNSLRTLRAIPIGTGDANSDLYDGFVHAAEYELYNASDVVYVEGYGYSAKENASPVKKRVQNNSGTQIVYTIDDLVFSGNNGLSEYEKEWTYTPDTSMYAMEYLQDGDIQKSSKFYRYSYSDMSSYVDSLGTICYAEIGMLNYQANGKTVVVPEKVIAYNDSTNQVRNVEYVEISRAYDSEVTSMIVPSTIQGFLYYDYVADTYTLLTADEVLANYGITVSYYDDFNKTFRTQSVSDAEYNQLTADEQAKYTLCSDSKTYDFVLLFDPHAGNEFQNSSVSIKVDIYAKQHQNTDDSTWIKTDSTLNSIVQSSIFTVDYDELHRVIITGVKAGTNVANMTEITIPEGVEVIPNKMFYNCTNLTTVYLPNTLTRIGSYAFAKCTNLANINLPDGLTEIGDYAFSECPNLKFLDIPGSVILIGEYMVENSGLEAVIIEEGVKEIGSKAFMDATNLSSVTLPNTLKKIGDSAFENCSSLTNITIPYGVNDIGSSAFNNSGLTYAEIPNTVIQIGDYAFENCTALTGIVLSNNLTEIEQSLFEGCSNLTSFTIDGLPSNYLGGKMKNIRPRAFYGTALSDITIPSNVNYVGFNAFSECNNLTEITIEAGPRLDSKVFVYSNGTLDTNVYTNNTSAINYKWSSHGRNATINVPNAPV
ncbi:MAG: leucine-rich repeat domain-containing protein [Acutalibacteraceae bacterium]|nr:leucine-rich repeat domain-containing protein [Acutalibacteraceae bacterium]